MAVPANRIEAKLHEVGMDVAPEVIAEALAKEGVQVTPQEVSAVRNRLRGEAPKPTPGD